MERDLIALVRDRLPHDGFIIGPGDDAAVLDAGRVAWSTDLAIEGVHFDLSLSSVADAAAKALVRNLSDLAAMGAEPLAFLLAVGLPPSLVTAVPDIAEGLADVCEEHGIRIAGGDLSRADALTFAISILGRVDRPSMTRAGAQVGDVVAVTGTLGEAAAGLAVLRNQSDAVLVDLGRRHPGLALRHRRGCARIAAGRALTGLATSAIDVSDGLGLDLGRVALASGVGMRLDLESLPAGPGVRDVEAHLGRRLALSGGDDYELAVTLAPSDVDEARARVEPLNFTVVGEVVEGRGVTDLAGVSVEEGHEHLV